MKKSVVTLGGKRVIIGLFFLVGMLMMESCSSSCKRNKRYWSRTRNCNMENISVTDTLPQFAFENNTIIMFK